MFDQESSFRTSQPFESEYSPEEVEHIKERTQAAIKKIEALKAEAKKSGHPIVRDNPNFTNINFLNVTENLLTVLKTNFAVIDHENELEKKNRLDVVVQRNYETACRKIKALEDYLELLNEVPEVRDAEMSGQEGHYAELQKEVDEHNDKETSPIEKYIELLRAEHLIHS